VYMYMYLTLFIYW